MEIGVLGMLALHAGSPVTPTSLVDLLWPNDPPRTAAKTLQGYVKRVRGLLAGSRIDLAYTGPAGYRLGLAPGQVDAIGFESLVASARTSNDDSVRLERLDAALSLWRGEPFAGCDLEGLGPFRQWLERLRSGARVERAATDIRRGISAETINAIRALIAQEPTNERLWLHLVAALYLFGNPVAALAATTEARRELDERVGVSPGPELMEIEHRIGVHDDVEGCYVRLTGIELGSATPSSGSRRANAALPLPVRAGDLIGRDDTLGEIARLIDVGTPVVTVAGPGGMGKTRCAVEAARRAGTRCEGFVDLSGITSADELAVHLAGTVGAPGRDDPVTAIADQLAGQRCSVLLDNAEQIDGAATVIGRLADHCPSVTWLVTSRTELGLDAERVTRLQPLPHDTTAGAVSPAAALLTSAARRRGVSWPAQAQPVIDRIAASIGGIPLALELAACQLQTLDPAALLRSLDDPLVTLVDHRRAVDRHRSMRACFQLGLDRLSPDALTLMALLSARANEAPYDDLAATWTRTPALPAVVAELVEVGFAASTTDTAGTTRVTQLPIVRALGSELTPADDLGPIRAALDAARPRPWPPITRRSSSPTSRTSAACSSTDWTTTADSSRPWPWPPRSSCTGGPTGSPRAAAGWPPCCAARPSILRPNDFSPSMRPSSSTIASATPIPPASGPRRRWPQGPGRPSTPCCCRAAPCWTSRTGTSNSLEQGPPSRWPSPERAVTPSRSGWRWATPAMWPSAPVIRTRLGSCTWNASTGCGAAG
jgi:DNA-binding SARP family transcriptional activator